MQMATFLKLDATNEELLQFARQWTDLLSTAKYVVAFDMLLHRGTFPGKSWCTNAEDLRAWIEGYGTDDPSPDEPPHKVTLVDEATGRAPIQKVLRGDSPYPGFVARLDYWLPLDGEWSDLMASFDFVNADGRLAGVLTALRVP